MGASCANVRKLLNLVFQELPNGKKGQSFACVVLFNLSGSNNIISVLQKLKRFSFCLSLTGMCILNN